MFVCPDVEALRDHPPAFGATPLIAKRDGVVPFVRELRRAKPDVLLSIERVNGKWLVNEVQQSS